MTDLLSFLQKMVVPSDNQRKNLGNCGIALLYLRKAGVKLCDEDGTEIVEDDVANGDKELTLSLLWNMFVDLQVKTVSRLYLQTLESLHLKLFSASGCQFHWFSNL